MMASYLWINIALIVCMASLGTSTFDFWRETECDTWKQKLATKQAISEPPKVVECIIKCTRETIRSIYEVTADECFKDLMQPYITHVLKKRLPSESKMQKCLEAEDRSNCKYTLLYFFTKWYKDHYTTDHYKRFAHFLFDTWANNPDIDHPVWFSNWEYYLLDELSYMRYNSDRDVQAVIKVTSPSDPSQFPVVHNELKRHCYKPVTEHTREFCQLRLVMTIAGKMRALAKNKAQYTDDVFQKHLQSVNFNFVVFSTLVDESRATSINPSTKEEKALVFDQRLTNLQELTRAGNTREMADYLQYMPEPYLLNKACQQTTFPVLARRSCVMVEVIEQLLIYSEIAEKRKKSSNTKAVTINFSLNLRAIITELRGEEIFKMMLENRYQAISNQEETNSLIEGKFDQLKGYFAKLQSYNMQKARADVDYVKGRITYYQGKTQKSIDGVSEHVGGVLKAALITQGLEVGEKTLKLAASIAEACNPFKVVFNGGTATDIMDATAELMKAISGLTEAIALKSAWEDVLATVTTIHNGFKKNSEFLSSVGRIVDKVKQNDFPDDDEFEQSKSTFLRLYNDYTPQVDKEMLAVVTTKFDTSVEAGCRLIDEATGSLANGYVAYVKDNLFCQKAEESTSSLKAIFEEIYDFQFEFIENMAEYLRSATGYHASQQMVTLTGRPMPTQNDANDRRNELRANVIMAQTTYEMQKQGAIQSLCDFLEYREGGRTPAVCQASPISLPTLLSYIPKRCTSVNKYVSLPTTTELDVPPGYINIKALYSGEEVSFDIPDYNWLKNHKWIDQDEDLEAIFIRDFQIFLPTVKQGENSIRVTAIPAGGNSFEDNGIKYSLIPTESYHLRYKVEKRFFPCSGKEMENPYSICEDRKLPKLCVMTDVPTFDESKRLYPTAFGRFKIKAKGVSASQAPAPTTDLDIKAKVNMCIFGREPLRKKREVPGPKPGCCSGNTYWNEGEKVCKPCTGSSRSNLNGYYCENNLQALQTRRKKKTSSSLK